MKVSHTTFKNTKKILKILESGYLKPAIDLDAEFNFGLPDIKFNAVYFNFYDTKYKNDFNISFILDSKFLLNNNFYFCIGWTFDKCNTKYQYKTKKELKDLYKKNILNMKSYEIHLKNKIGIYHNKKFTDIEKNFCYKFTHEILFHDKVSLHDYLLEIFLHYKDEKLESYIKENYPKCKINRVYNDKKFIQYLIDKKQFEFYSTNIDR